jgi:predicted ATPase
LGYTWPDEEYADTDEAEEAWEEAWDTDIPVPVTFRRLKGLKAALQALEGAYRGAVLRFERPTSGAMLSPPDLGVGVSQVIPVIVACCVGESRASERLERPPSAVLIEQPELHVHPAVQVGLGDLFLAARKDRQILVETHSEHLVLRLLRRIRETAAGELPDGAPDASPADVAVTYIEPGTGGVRCRSLPVTDEGEFAAEWPNGFFDERFQELY